MLFLASDESSFITASQFLVDGGISGGLRDAAVIRSRGAPAECDHAWTDP